MSWLDFIGNIGNKIKYANAPQIPTLQMAENGVTVITDMSNVEYSEKKDLNEIIENIPTNPRFMYAALAAFGPEKVMDFFEDAGVPLKTERGNRVFPISDKAVDIVDALVKDAKKQGVKFMYNACLDFGLSRMGSRYQSERGSSKSWRQCC